MFTGRLEPSPIYRQCLPHWDEILAFAAQIDPQLPPGSYRLDCGVEVLLKSYQTKAPEACRYESHRRTIDLMIGLEGEEYIYFLPADGLTPAEEQPQRDAIKYRENPLASRVLLSPGFFAAFFPGEAHGVGIQAGESRSLKKLVVKLPWGERAP